MELNTLSVQNHDFSANTKVFIIDFDNVNSSRDLVHALTKISMLKYMSMRREAFLDKKEVSKEEFESIILFLSSYAKAKHMNSRLQNLFTIVDERNSESEFTGILQFRERLSEFVEYETELIDFDPYHEYFSVSKEELKNMAVDWVRHMLMISSSRGIMQTGLTIPSKSVACIRLDDLYAITSDYCVESEEFEDFIQPLERATTQLFGRMARADKKGNKIIRENASTYVEGDISTREKVESNKVLILFKATESKSGDRIDFFKCITLLEKIPSIKVCDEIFYCSFKIHRGNSKSLLENDPSYNLEINQEYVSRIVKTGKRDLVFEICSHLGIIDTSKMKPPSETEILGIRGETDQTKKSSEDHEKYLESLYDTHIFTEVVETVEKIMSYGFPKEYISVNWANTRSVISGLSNESLFIELDKISKDAKESEMGFFKFFEEIYYPKKVKISKSKSKINLRINLAVSRSIAVPHLKKINDTFGEKTMNAKFTEIVKKRLKKDFP
jgi:hypothetical protein